MLYVELIKAEIIHAVNLVITLLAGIPMNHFCYADKAFQFLDKLRAIMPAQLLASYPTLQVYQSYEIGPWIVKLPYMMAFAVFAEMFIMLLWLGYREGGK